MKKVICILLVAFAIDTKGQIAIEFAHDSASTIGGIISSSGTVNNQLLLVNFEVSGMQYVKVNRNGKNISIYNMSHSLVKTMSWASAPSDTFGVNNIGFLYFSQLLFNTDNKIEYMYCYIYKDMHGNAYATNIYNEDGTILFTDTAYPAILANTPLQQYPIYNTPSNGTKMILSDRTGHAKVYSLPGTLTTAIDRTSHSFKGNMGNAYPNPTANTTTIPYTLPQGTTQGELVFYNMQGTEVKHFKVDNTFSSLLISTADIPAGTYYYQLQTGGNASSAKKLIIIK
jgi:hypothetical protein